jgi:hypothetical protein
VIASAILYIGITIILCAVAVLAWLGIGQLELSGSAALERDGLARGERAPSWSLPDSAGTVQASPPSARLQLVVFADHSLKSFPSVADGLRQLGETGTDLDIVIVTRGPSPGVTGVLAHLGLAAIPVVTGSPRLYAHYNVRVMPFAIFTDPAGQVRASSLVNHDWQLAKLHRIARIPVDADREAKRPRPAFRLAV